MLAQPLIDISRELCLDFRSQNDFIIHRLYCGTGNANWSENARIICYNPRSRTKHARIIGTYNFYFGIGNINDVIYHI